MDLGSFSRLRRVAFLTRRNVEEQAELVSIVECSGAHRHDGVRGGTLARRPRSPSICLQPSICSKIGPNLICDYY